MRMLIAAGGTGGHLFPGIAVGEVLKEIDPGGDVLFVGGSRGIEKDILRKTGFPHEVLEVGRIKGEGFSGRLKTVCRLPGALIEARRLLEKYRPNILFGVGGYLSGPVVLAAFFGRIPRAILEPNSIPGFTNRILGRIADRVFVAFPETARFFPAKKVLMTGTPVRRELTQVGKARRGIPPQKPFTIVILGGSQGAASLNRAVIETLPVLQGRPSRFRIIHQTGEKEYETMREAYNRYSFPSEVAPFIDDVAAVYRDADLVISRAGASTIAELIETRSPSVLVPYPHAADDHQRFNALSIVQAGGGEMILDRDLSSKKGGQTLLAERILHYEGQPAELERMREALGRMRQVPAAEAVAGECLKLAGPGRR